ncbi:GNAT family N-acetyltransferase [Vibrio sp. Of7-15]|uniref:GNAT family N-acetyltransferase n=1 Tax=Vibrio sp. Of7-15 TaxID=2724879 RepID=UPI001EF2D257|nr:GNAT family N-acetyltransferase [Vibrio sp. Of7-15]MCG7497858.1 GNAT family N-acetyltransferase [Vibrio sp. Of7-15]
MEITLRKATQEDISFLLDLRDITMRKYLEAASMPTDPQSYLTRILLHFEDAQIILVNGHSAGLFKSRYLSELNQWYLFQIQVHSDFQNQNIGSTLIKSLIDKAKHDQANVGLSVIKSNPARHLYTRLGFEQTGESEFEYKMAYPFKNDC